jgi:hypothetical protein
VLFTCSNKAARHPQLHVRLPLTSPSNHRGFLSNHSTSRSISMGSMASSTTANRSNHIVNDDAYDRAKALYLTETHEKGGSVLKDYYTRDEYRHRRGRFLSKLAEHPKPSVDHWANSKVDADMIFGTDDDQLQLDVQQVRDLELEMEFDVLLPLPTTVNTQTIDSFKTCPPADGNREADEADDDGEVVEDGRDVPTPGGSFTHSTPGTSPAEGVATYDKYASHQLSNPAQFTNASKMPALPFATFPDHQSLSRPVEASSLPPIPPIKLFTIGRTQPDANKATTLSLRKPAGQNPQDEAIPTAVEVQRPTIIFATPPVPKTFVPHPDVSSMAHYGMAPPVKGPKRQHIQEAAMMEESNPIRPNAPVAKMTASKPTSNLNISTTAEDLDRPNSPGDPVEPPSKKLKDVSGVAKPVKTPPVATATDLTQNDTPTISVPKSAPVDSTTISVPNMAPPTVTSSPNLAPTVNATPNVAAVAQTSTPLPRLNDIITGRILPRTKMEATEAANELHNRLLAGYNAQGQGQANNRKSVRQSTSNLNNINQDPDFMPHYFSPANFTETEQEVGAVRCVCGVIEDDASRPSPMTCCDKCEAWQHSGCVAPHLIGKSEEDLKKVNFYCTVCDPYTHRHVLQKVRAGKFPGEQNGKGQAKTKGAPKGKISTPVAAKGKGRGKGKK